MEVGNGDGEKRKEEEGGVWDWQMVVVLMESGKRAGEGTAQQL